MAVAAGVSPLRDTRAAFDAVAGDYHRANSANPVLSAMRERALAAVRRFVPPGSRVLDLGCGPGTDDHKLAMAGYRVCAIDWSPVMVEEARRRVARGGLEDRVEVRRLGIQEIGELPAASFDAAFSNFGPLNCVPDLEQAAHLIAGRLGPGGVLVASVIGRVVPWELARYATSGDWKRMRVRFARGLVPVPLLANRVWTRYYTPREFDRMFRAAGLERVWLRALGLFVPPPYMERFASRHPRAVRALQALEDGTGAWPGIRSCGDHFLVVMKKTGP